MGSVSLALSRRLSFICRKGSKIVRESTIQVSLDKVKQEADIIALAAFAARLWVQNVELEGSSSGFPEAICLQGSQGGRNWLSQELLLLWF